MPERLDCDRYTVDGRELICARSEDVIRRISLDAIRGWCDTGQGKVLTLSIVMKEGRSIDLPDTSGELEQILSHHFPDSFHSW